MFISAVAMPKTPAATSWRRVHPAHQRRDTASRAIVAPIRRNQATVCGSTSSNSSTAIAAPMYWAIAERTNSASGWVVFSHRVTGPGARATRYSKSSGSEREISSHIGWKLNHPARWYPVWSRV